MPSSSSNEFQRAVTPTPSDKLAHGEEAIRKRRVFLVDDHPLMIESLTGLIDKTDDLIMCGAATDSPSALQSIASVSPDVLVADLNLERGSGIDLVRDIHRDRRDLPVLVLSMHDESLFAQRLIRVGARGYLSKRQCSRKIIAALRQVLDGQIYMSEELRTHILVSLVENRGLRDDPLSALSNRELEVFVLIGQGLGTRDIADHLMIGLKMIQHCRLQIQNKLDLANSNELSLEAAMWWDRSFGVSIAN